MRKASPRENVEIPAWAEFYWSAYMDLVNDRNYVTETQFVPVPNGIPIPISRSRPLPLQWATLRAYADHNEISDFALFCKLMRGMDVEFMTINAEQAKGPSEENDGG
jgi:hypothetical protein